MMSSSNYAKPPVLSSTIFWLRYEAWGQSIAYWNRPNSVLGLCQRLGSTLHASLIAAVMLGYCAAALWAYSLMLRHRARRLGLLVFCACPSGEWLPAVRYSLACLSKAIRFQVLILASTTFAAHILYATCELAMVAFPAHELTLWRGVSTVYAAIPRLALLLGALLGVTYVIISCNHLSRVVVRTEYRRAPRHCKRCGYPLGHAQGCPECGPGSPSVRGCSVDHLMQLCLRPPRASLLIIVLAVCCMFASQAARGLIVREIRTSNTLQRPAKWETSSQQAKYILGMWTCFDYLLQLQLDTEYRLTLDGKTIVIAVSSEDSQSMVVSWDCGDGLPQAVAFVPAKPWEAPGDLEDQWKRVPVINVGSCLLFFQVGDNIPFDGGPNRVDVRVFAKSLVAEPL